MGDLRQGKGTVKFFNDSKGYGFILLDDKETEVFVHQTKIKMEGHRTLHENQPVDLEYYKEEKGWKAEIVKPDMAWAKENVRSSDRRDDRYGSRGGEYDRRGGGGYRDSYNDGYDRRGGGYDRGGYSSSYGYDRPNYSYGGSGYSSGGGGSYRHEGYGYH